MGTRQELQVLLKGLAGNAYFQPPEDIKLTYPCAVYERDQIRSTFADGLPYSRRKRYSVTIITQDPDSDIPDKIAALPMCVHDRHYTADNLHHDVFKLFF